MDDKFDPPAEPRGPAGSAQDSDQNHAQDSDRSAGSGGWSGLQIVVLVIAAVLGATGGDLAYSGLPDDLVGRVLLVLTVAAAASLIVFTAIKPNWAWSNVKSWLGHHPRPALGAVVAALMTITFIAVTVWVGGEPDPVPDDCGYPDEVRVLTSPDSLATVQRVADAYVQWEADRQGGCQQVSIHVFAAPFEGTGGAKDTLLAGWPSDPALRQWPRPDVWLSDSSHDVDTIDGGPSDLVSIADRQKVARTPLVLAVPVDDQDALGTESRWADLYENVIASEDWRVFRPNPRLSAAGVAATTILHSERVPATRQDEPAGQLEREIDSPLAENDLLCGIFADRSPLPAAMVTERTLIAYNQGGLSCGPPAFDRRLVAVYPEDTVHLFQEFVRFDWPATADSRNAAAREFGAWLSGPEGKEALRDARLRPVGETAAGPINAEWGADPLGTIGSPLDAVEVEVALRRYREVRDPGLLMLLLDTSGSMATEVNASGNRFQLAGQAVVGALDLMIAEDEFTLRAFPAEGLRDQDAHSTTVLSVDGRGDLAQRQEQVERELRGVAGIIGGETPLFDAIDESARAMTGQADPGQVRALVVVTDGHDSTSSIGVAALGERLAAEGARLFAVAVGEASCQAGLDRLAEGSGGQCYPTTIDNLDLTLSEIAAGLWRGGE